jgi:hypothetical protein
MKEWTNEAKDQFAMKQDPKLDFAIFKQLLVQKSPFTFIRFSDGELDVIKNRKVHIGKEVVRWDENVLIHDYPVYDYKDFDPIKNQDIRTLLIASASHVGRNFFKGIPAKHNNAVDDRNLMISLNQNSLNSLTFADLLINQNFLLFRKTFLNLFLKFSNVYYVGNFRANPKQFSDKLEHISVQDNFFLNFQSEMDSIFNQVKETPPNSLILLSASSLSNIIALKLNSIRPDLTMIDIGTSMHDLVGLGSGIREYHKLLLSNKPTDFYRKHRYKLSGYYRMHW